MLNLHSLPVMMYHSVCNRKGRLYVSPQLLEKHCRALAANGWRGISLAEAEAYYIEGKPLAPKSCLFTFDDGYLDNFVYAEPILRKYGHCGVIFPIVHLVEKRDALVAPNSEDLCANPDRIKELEGVDTTIHRQKSGFHLPYFRFCSWEELRQMQARGTMAAAPHSLTHGRVVVSLDVKQLRIPGEFHMHFFGTPPYHVPFGMPLFETDYALSNRAYTVNPELFDLVKSMVPQSFAAAKEFFADPKKRASVYKAIAALPYLGRRETEEEFRERLFAEFTECKNTFIKELGVEPRTFCWPWGGSCKESVEEAERAGFKVLVCVSQADGKKRGVHLVRRFSVRYFTTPERLLQLLRLFSIRPFIPLYSKGVKTWRKIKSLKSLL